MPKFKIGDKIVINNHNIEPIWWFKPGQKGVVDTVNEAGGKISFIGTDRHGINRRGYIQEDQADLEEDEIPLNPAPMGNFVFCSEGGKYYTKGKFASLEQAERKAVRLRRIHGTENIYPFVMVK